MGWRIIEVIGLRGGMMRNIAKIMLDARGRIRQSDADFKTAPNNGRGPISCQLAGSGNVLDDVVFEIAIVVSNLLESSSHNGQQFYLLSHQVATVQRCMGIADSIEQGSQIREKADQIGRASCRE